MKINSQDKFDISILIYLEQKRIKNSIIFYYQSEIDLSDKEVLWITIFREISHEEMSL